jgi:hypothetical protein
MAEGGENISSEEEMSDGDIFGDLGKFCRHRNWKNLRSYWENIRVPIPIHTSPNLQWSMV